MPGMLPFCIFIKWMIGYIDADCLLEDYTFVQGRPDL